MKLTFLPFVGEFLSGFLAEIGDLGAAGFLSDGDDFGALIVVEVIGPIGADGRKREMHFGTEAAGSVLQPEAEGMKIIPIHEEEIVAAIALNIEDLDGFDGADVRDFFGFS